MIIKSPFKEDDFKIGVNLPSYRVAKEIYNPETPIKIGTFTPPTAIKEDENGNIKLAVRHVSNSPLNVQKDLSTEQKIIETENGLSNTGIKPPVISFGDPTKKDEILKQGLPKTETMETPKEVIQKEPIKKANWTLIISIVALIVGVYLIWK